MAGMLCSLDSIFCARSLEVEFPRGFWPSDSPNLQWCGRHQAGTWGKRSRDCRCAIEKAGSVCQWTD